MLRRALTVPGTCSGGLGQLARSAIARMQEGARGVLFDVIAYTGGPTAEELLDQVRCLGGVP